MSGTATAYAMPADGGTVLGEGWQDRVHDLYREVREDGGIRHVRYPGGAPVEGWVVTGYAEAKALLADPRLSKNQAVQRLGRRTGADQGPGSGLFSHMLNADPPDHTRLRRLVQQAFTARRTAVLRPSIERHVDRLLDALDAGTEAELIADFALPLPLPVAVVFDLFGASDADHEKLRVRGNTFDGGPGDGEVSVLTAESMHAYLRALMALKREQPDDGLLSALLTAREDDRLTEDEITSMAFLLVIAGHQTTVNLIANALHSLLTHPAELAALRADPSLVRGAVEEALRYESPSGLASLRYATEPVRIGEVTVQEGEFVHISLLGADRDPAVFPDPDRFDIRRADVSRHLAFGHGIHHCLGASLARLQAEIALARIVERFPGLRPHEQHEARWQPNPRHRGLLSLPVHLRRN
ncbi:cytochrome P450 [Streptomyces sp. VRA16 Mangrove soil]|uniref:cytochrome P450 family protein n=1 Tax=Streptomyces sp. VRA16 Mangrove soil TaxID=2817434 RepID=UPI001A9CC971|nr:cytochrome P450 [Streptomyces sp. VRA16 Mangrove soil]MBO1332176.1 cytochrome P450 [Streptomyces sp. VRA16 Mangrove soil]